MRSRGAAVRRGTVRPSPCLCELNDGPGKPEESACSIRGKPEPRSSGPEHCHAWRLHRKPARPESSRARWGTAGCTGGQAPPPYANLRLLFTHPKT